MGTHTKSPSTVEGKPLSDVLAANPNFIGDDVAKKFDTAGGNLPYLFKVLAIAKALSIQSHPDKATAEKLHIEQPDVYKGAYMVCVLWSLGCVRVPFTMHSRLAICVSDIRTHTIG